jgi:hypothetical protein
MRRWTTGLVFSTGTLLFVSSLAMSAWHQTPQIVQNHAYHISPPSAPLPPTLDPVPFAANRAAFVAYTLAARVEPILYQVPCYCGCDRELGHQSLLDCFTGRHGIFCHTCQKEAVFCYVEHKRARTVAQIRGDLEKARPSDPDFRRYIDHFYGEIHQPSR